MNSEECPGCDEGVLSRYWVNATGETVQVCNECDSMWEEADDLPAPATTTVEHLRAARGLPLLWTQLSALA